MPLRLASNVASTPSHSDAKLFYGGTKADSLPTGDRKVTSATATDCENDRLGIHHWARHGINGRGVLLDFARFAADIDYAEFSPTKHHAISTQQLEAVAKLQGVDFRQGDILVVRTGFIKVRIERIFVSTTAACDRTGAQGIVARTS